MDVALEQMPSAIWARRLLLAEVGAITFSIALGQFLLALACVPLVIWLARARPRLRPRRRQFHVRRHRPDG